MSVFSGEVKDVSSEGLGVVVHPNGMTFFVPGAWPGDQGEFQVVRHEKRYGFARWYKQTGFSKDRQDILCRHMGFEEGLCGGCPWLFVKYEKQLEYKQKMLETSFKRSKIDVPILPIQASPKDLSYRRRANLKTDGTKVGYVSPQSRVLAPIEDCIILTDHVRSSLKFIRAQLPNKKWKPSGRHQWNFIEIDEDIPEDAITINQRRSFQQANAFSNAYMQEWLRQEIAGSSADQQVLELFCGSGNFTEILSQHFQAVFACEMSGDAVTTLKNKNFSNLQIMELDIFAKIKWPELFKQTMSTQILVLDPPREGFRDLSLFTPRWTQLKQIIYVSCNPQTFLGDVKPLLEQGWKLKKIQPVDQFPNTPHVELLSVLERNIDEKTF